jgi:CPA2 family monovalent cation:H+ antiporter-2
MVLSESEYSHQALSDIIPLREVFGMLFFVSVGMLLDPAFLLDNLALVLLVVLLVMVGKAAIFGVLTRAFGYRDITPFAVGLGLFQIGEFAFVLARVGLAERAISANLYALVLATALTTMILTPFGPRAVGPLYAWYRRLRPAAPAQPANLPDHELHDHIIIAGYGRVGRYTADLLKTLGLPFVVIELDEHLMQQAKIAQIPMIYGDAGSAVVLEAAGVHSARLVLVAVSAAIDVELIVRRVRETNPALHIVARAARRAQVDVLRSLGIYEVVQPEFEAGLEMVRQTLLHFDIPAAEIERLSDEVRNELYQPFQNPHADALLVDRMRRARQALDVAWYDLAADAPLVGRSIRTSGIRQRTGLSIVAVLRGDTVISNPTPDLVLNDGDRLGIVGTAAQRRGFAEWLAAGHADHGAHVDDLALPLALPATPADADPGA